MKNFLIDPLKNLKSYNRLLEDIDRGLSPIVTHGIIDENLSHIIYGLKEHVDRQILVVTYDEIKAKRIYEDLKDLGNANVEVFPNREMLFYDMHASSYENLAKRLMLISKLNHNEKLIVVASIESLLEKILSKDIFNRYTQSIEFGKEIDLDLFARNLIDAGYERVHMIEGIGQFSIRGGIVDFFPPNSANPYRIELFADEIDSIRTFDIMTQRSIENRDMVTIPPIRDVLIPEEYREDVITKIKDELYNFGSKDRTKEKFLGYIDILEENSSLNNKDMIIPYLPEKILSSIVDYFQEDALIFIDEPSRVGERVESSREDFHLKFKELLELGELLPSHLNMMYDYKEVLDNILDRKVIANSSILKGHSEIKAKNIHDFSVKSMVNYHNKMELLVEDLNHYKYRGYKIIILTGTEERGLRLKKNLMDLGVMGNFINGREGEISSGQLIITTGSIQGGFEYPSIKLVVISDKEIFGAQKKKSKTTKKKRGDKIINLSDLTIGSYVVHENHGIGRYEGIEQLDIQGIKKDYLTIRYKNQDKLYIPIDQMNLIQKYSGSDDVKPKINRLNSGDWQKTKARAKKAVEDMAQDLLRLYAKRETLSGYAFSEDTPWQRQFEDLFSFEETEGQLRSTMEIKKDMESNRPMDRLLCGDVGYGKTEVALRAAFKALMDGKQVAILVPTTILAQQHYNTIIDRFRDFPIKPALLSRFKTPKEQKLAIEGIANGIVDIVVGTHRLLSKDVKFKDLGLLIIDEEQRFGVKHKEELKKLRENIDILTLSATPIPRTLHMSLVGIRDMSIIEEPPEERYPIQTYVVEFNEQMIRDAILKEIGRGGQVYFVYNRVETIERMASELRKLIPEANISIGHGQMGERQLEKVMMDFLNGENDVLVCTTIIETGLDIPNVNTIIVYDADKMGLSQLYQLRGRVGRTNRIAYGYFTYGKDRVLSEVAEKRLRAIKEFTEFGSGFKIAMRDLEIRGAGNLLGSEQHGHIEAIGYDLYVKFLSDTIKKLKGEEVIEQIDTTIDIKVDGYIPDKFIEDEMQKIEIYKKIAAIDSIEDYNELMDELIDRFGDIPIEVENLMDISYIKALGSKNRIQNISQINGSIKLDLISNKDISLELISMLSGEYRRNISFNLSEKPYLEFRTKKSVLAEVKDLLEKIYTFNREKNNI